LKQHGHSVDRGKCSKHSVAPSGPEFDLDARLILRVDCASPTLDNV
jgi:hypothetical protein